MRWAFFIFLFLAVLSSFRPIKDHDIWGHLKTAEVALATGEGAFRDVFSHTARGNRITNQEHGSQLLLLAISKPWGLLGIRLFVAYAVGIVLIVGFLAASGGRDPMLGWGASILIFAASFSRIAPRPGIFTLLFTVALVPLLLRTRTDRSWRTTAGVGLFFLLWYNLHGEALIGTGLSLLFVLTESARSRRIPFPLLGVLLITPFLQPLGGSLIADVFHESRASSTYISEWQPLLPALFSAGHWRPLVGIGVLLGALLPVLLRGWREIPPSEMFLASAGTVVGLSAVRESSWLIVPALLLVGWLQRNPLGNKARAFLIPVLTGAALLGIPWNYLSIRSWMTEVDTAHFPVAQTRFLRESGIRGNLFNFYDIGGYLIYHLHPNLPVFIDPRFSPYPAQVREDARRILEGAPGASEALDRYGVDILLIRDGYCEKNCRKGAWVKLFSDGHYAVFLRNNDRNRENLRRAESLRIPLRCYDFAEEEDFRDCARKRG
jgi:hypothetical protein